MTRHHLTEPMTLASPKVGWRVNEWSASVGVSRAFTWELIAEKKIGSVKAGKARIITTSPTAYLAALGDR